MKPNNYHPGEQRLSSYIESLISPPQLPNPLKRSSSQKNINDSAISINNPPSNISVLQSKKLTPMKKRPHSEDSSSQLFATIKQYGEGQNEGGSMLSRMSELTDGASLPVPPKEVTFRQNLIMRKGNNRRDTGSNQGRTPSILKKSQLLRNNCIQFLQQNGHASADRTPPKEDREDRAIRTNEIVKRRYQTIMDRFDAKFGGKVKKGAQLRSDEKYQDDLYPPITSSIFRGGKVSQNLINGVRWIRISQLCPNRQLTVYNQDAGSSVFLKCRHQCTNFMGEAFNCIKNCRQILGRMFQSPQVSDYGVYLVKIFQENVWKYVIVDDYIPVKPNEVGQLSPIFLDSIHTDQDLPFQIWPFLLQKAYANYYANYESLHYGNTLDFLEEITGMTAQVFHHHNSQKKNTEKMNRLRRYVSIDDVVLLGVVESQNVYVPLEKNGEEGIIAYLSSEQATTTININQLFEYFDKVCIIAPSKWTHSCVSTIGINVRKNQTPSRFDISLRTLKITKGGTVSLSIRQRQRRLYQRSSLNYSYIWVRVILLQREFDGDCRWIDGKYSNSKSINILARLEPGEYYIILLPEWRSSHCYELSLLAHSDSPITLARRDYDDNQQFLEKGCCDLAQRRGRLQQINLYACSYTLIHQQLGMLFENINNQRYQGSIRINRSIAGLKPALELVPFNREFYLQKTHKAPFNSHLSVYIPADHSFTVVLMMRGGIDLPFLRKFDFGR